jgi:hypothetical protein
MGTVFLERVGEMVSTALVGHFDGEAKTAT